MRYSAAVLVAWLGGLTWCQKWVPVLVFSILKYSSEFKTKKKVVDSLSGNVIDIVVNLLNMSYHPSKIPESALALVPLNLQTVFFFQTSETSTNH